MESTMKGLAYIYLSSKTCEHLKDDVVSCLKNLQFQVIPTFMNYTQKEIKNSLTAALRSENKSFDCIIFVFLSKSKNVGEIYCQDGTIKERDIVNTFSHSICEIPRLFFIMSPLEDNTVFKKYHKERLPSDENIFILRNYCSNRFTRIFFETLSTLKGYTSIYQAVLKAVRLANNEMAKDETAIDESAIDDITMDETAIDVTPKDEIAIDGFNKIPEIVSTLKSPIFFISNKPTNYDLMGLDAPLLPNVGILYLFNFYNAYNPLLDHFLARRGAKFDSQRINKSFKTIGFNVKVYNDSKKEDILKILRSDEVDYSNDRCVAVCILSYSIDGKYGTMDDLISDDELFEAISIHKTLENKPKIFIATVCGLYEDCFTAYSLPDDFLVIKAVYADDTAYRDAELGSVFIQNFCERLQCVRSDVPVDIMDVLLNVQKYLGALNLSLKKLFHRNYLHVLSTLSTTVRFCNNGGNLI